MAESNGKKVGWGVVAVVLAALTPGGFAMGWLVTKEANARVLEARVGMVERKLDVVEQLALDVAIIKRDVQYMRADMKELKQLQERR